MERNMCRICLSDQKCFISIRDKFGDRFIWSVINDIGDVSVSEYDDYPQMLCNICYKRLTEATNFKEEIKQTERLLKGQQIHQEEEEDTETKLQVEYLLDDPEAQAAIITVMSDLETTSVHEPDEESNEDTIEGEVMECQTEQEKYLLTETKSPIDCCLCDATFLDMESCESHITECHIGQVDDNITFRNKFKIFQFFCPVCQKGFRRKMSIAQHLSDKTFIEKPKKKANDAKKWRKPTQCQACGKIFSDKFEAMYHYDRVHEKNKTIKCEQCEKLFASRKLLNRHMITHAPKNHICSLCDKSFPQISQLKSHMDRHLAVKKFKCDLCPKTFSHKRVLETHIMQHSDLKPFKCTECPKMYKWPEDLNTHVKAEHQGIFPYFCAFCNKGYTSSSNKKYHEARCSLNLNRINVSRIREEKMNKIVT